MAEGNGAIFNNFKEQIMLGTLALDSDTIKVCLVDGWTPTVDGNVTYGSVTGYEESGTGYSAGGETLASSSVTQDDGNDRAAFDGPDVTWTGLNVGTPTYAVCYDDTVAGKPGICYWELGRASNGSDYKLSFNGNGIILLT